MARARPSGASVNSPRVGTSVVATKFPAGFLARQNSLPATLDASLNRLRRPVIDLYQIHYPVRWMSIPKLMDMMAAAVEAGKVRTVGVSNYSAAQMRTAHAALAERGIPLASNQVQYSLLHRDPEVDGVLEACRELSVTLIAYMPLASGALTGKYADGQRPSGWRRYTGFFRGKNIPKIQTINELLREIAKRHDRSASQVALRWLIQREVLPIPGAKNARQAAQNVGALSFALSQSDMDALGEATA